MAKSETAGKKKRKGIVQRMMFGDDSKPDLTPERMKMSKWAMFKYLFFHRFGTMVFLNFLTVLFALPAAAVIVLFYLNITVADSFIPYSANIGIGYPVITNAISQGDLASFGFQTMEFLILVPCIAVFALGVAGNLYVMRKLLWEEPVRTFKDFFRGIKKSWLPAVVIGFAFGLTLLLVVFSLGYFDAYKLSVSLKALCVTLSMILLVFMILFTSFFLTQAVAFKMRPMALMKNSILFIIGTNFMAIVMIGIALAPVYLMFIPGITMILVMLYVFLGFSFTTLVVTLFCHYCYERYLYDKIDDKPSTVYFKRNDNDAEDNAADAQSRKKQSPAPYKNPKKRKKSIDEGSSITPLTPTFRREDLERLEKEHRKVLSESEESDADSIAADGGPNAQPPDDAATGDVKPAETNKDTE